jgi:hypothetical protein
MKGILCPFDAHRMTLIIRRSEALHILRGLTKSKAIAYNMPISEFVRNLRHLFNITREEIAEPATEAPERRTTYEANRIVEEVDENGNSTLTVSVPPRTDPIRRLRRER